MSSRLDWGDTRKRILDPGTLQGLCELYPSGQPTPGCANLTPPDSGTPEPSKGGCSATSSAPLLGALVLLLGVRRSRTRV